MKTQVVICKDGTQVAVPCKNSYSKLTLENQMGVLLWTLDNFVIPHENVLAIIESEVPDKPEIEETT